MSWFAKARKKVQNAVKKTVNNIKKPIEKATDWAGSLLNNVTGVTASARQQYEYNQYLQNTAQEYNAQQAQISRDWETEMSNTARQRGTADMKAAGLNPVLSAGEGAWAGAGAQATSPGGSTGAGVSGGNPISMITDLINASNNTSRTQADITKANADAIHTLTEAGYTEEKIKNATHERDLIIQSIKTAKSEEEKKKAETKLIKWNTDHALLIQVMPAIAGIAGGIIGGALGQPLGGALGGALSARKNPIGFQP